MATAYSDTKERTVSLDEAVRERIDRRRGELNLGRDQGEEVDRSRAINLALGLLFGKPPAGADRELLEELLEEDVLAFVERTADSKGRARLGGTQHAEREVLVVAVEEPDG